VSDDQLGLASKRECRVRAVDQPKGCLGVTVDTASEVSLCARAVSSLHSPTNPTLPISASVLFIVDVALSYDAVKIRSSIARVNRCRVELSIMHVEEALAFE